MVRKRGLARHTALVIILGFMSGLVSCRTPLNSVRVTRLTPTPPQVTPAAARASPFGINSHIASRHPDFATLAEPAGLVGNLDVGWVREDVQWSRVEPSPGNFDWSWHDTVFAAHRQRGIHIIGVIGPAVGWGTPELNDRPHDVSFFAPDPERYAAFAAAVASRYKGVVDAWEIWNEPENGVLWQPAPDPVRYAHLLKQASAAIKAVDPQVLVLNGGVVPYDPTFLDTIAAQDAWDAFDVLSVHAYVDPWTPETGQIGVVGVRQVAQLAAKYGRKPIWVTEFGWSTGPCERDPKGLTDEEEQANFLVRAAALLRSAGAERVLWYNLKDHPGQACYGLVRGGESDALYDSLKPSAAAFRVLSSQIANREPLGSQDFMPHVIAATFDDVGDWGPPFQATAEPMQSTTAQVYRGTGAARIAYRFGQPDNEYVAFPYHGARFLPTDTSRIGLWVYGDGSGHILHLRLRDAAGEVLQYRLGFIGATGWHFLSTSITGAVEEGNRIVPGNGQLDGTLQIRELVIDDHPDGATGTGAIYVDELTVFQGPEVYAERFAVGSSATEGVVDLIWALAPTTITLSTAAANVTMTSRDGSATSLEADDGQVMIAVGPAPVYVRHVPTPGGHG